MEVKKRVRLLYITSTLGKSGPMIVLANIIKYLDLEKFDPTVLTLSPEPSSTMAALFRESLKVEVHSLALSRMQGLVHGMSRVKRYLSTNNIDLVHTHGVRADCMVRYSRIPTVSTLHNDPYKDYPIAYGKTLGTALAKLHLMFLRRITYPVAVSQSVSEKLRKRNRIHLEHVRNGVDVKSVPGTDKRSLRSQLKLDNYSHVFVSVGVLSKRKDPMTIIQGFLKASLPNAALILLGDGECRALCEAMAAHTPNIHFLGKVDNVWEYLAASDCFISASLVEGLPNSVLEAMACGLPCILSDIEPHREISNLDTRSSLLFRVQHPEELSSELRKIAVKDLEEMSRASTNISHNTLNAAAMSEAYQAIYTSLLER